MSGYPEGMSSTPSIAYFATLLDGPNSGAGKKVLDQGNTWRLMGIATKLYIISDQAHVSEWANQKDVLVVTERQGLAKLRLRLSFLKSIFKTNPETLYIRDSFPFIFPRVPKSTSIILEVQTLMREELLSRNRLRAMQSWLLDKFYLSRFTKFVFVSYEIGASKRFAMYRSQDNSTVISNGVKLDQITEIKKLAQKDPVEFIFLGQNGQPWHGVEQILELARCMPSYMFNIVGVTDKFLNVPSNAIFHGVLTQSEYFPIAEKCVLGIGTLNLKAKGMTEGSSLKVREYLAMGLPVFLRHTDTDFMDCPSYILELPNDDTPITRFVDRIVGFAELWSDERVPGSKITRIDMKEKESQRLEFILGNSSSN